MARRHAWLAAVFALLLLAVAFWPRPEDAPVRDERPAESRPSAVAAPPPAEPPAQPYAEPKPPVPPATDSTQEPVTVRIDALPYESSEAQRTVKIRFDDLGRLEVETECEPALVFTVDVYATVAGVLKWIAGGDGLADLRANLRLGNREYLTQPHWSQMRTTLVNHGVKSGADIEVRITYFDLEGRPHHEERYHLEMP